MHKIGSADWADFTLGEEAGERQTRKRGIHGGRVVVWSIEESRATTVAGKKQTTRRVGARGSRFGKQRLQIFIGRLGVANMQLHRLANAQIIADRKGPEIWISANDVTNQKIATAKSILIFVDDSPNVQSLLKRSLLIRR